MQRHSGFTLLDMVIALAIAGILAALAIPSYQYFINKSRLQNIQLELLALQSEQEKYRLSHNTYATLTALSVPASAHYRISFENVGPQSYKLVASNKQADAACAQVSIDHTFARHPLECWE